MTSDWLITQGKPSATQRLYVFPYAGGNPAAFIGFSAALGPEIEVSVLNLPGRGLRSHMAQPQDLRQIAREIAGAISLDASQNNIKNFSFFGHSMGAVLALEVLRICTLMHLPMPKVMIASGCRWPGDLDRTNPLHTLSEDAFRAQLKKLGGTPDEILNHDELMTLITPILRADFAMSHGYEYRPSIPLPVPLHVFAGRADPKVLHQHLTPWFSESQYPGQLYWFEGGHFFLHDTATEFFTKLREVLL